MLLVFCDGNWFRVAIVDKSPPSYEGKQEPQRTHTLGICEIATRNSRWSEHRWVSGPLDCSRRRWERRVFKVEREDGPRKANAQPCRQGVHPDVGCFFLWSHAPIPSRHM